MATAVNERPWRIPGRLAGGGAAFSLACAAIGLAATLAAPARAQTLDLTMAVIPAPGDAYSSLTSTVPERFARATDGKIKVTISDSLVPGGQIVSAVRDGRVDMSAALHTYLAAEEPRFGIFNLPGLIGGMPDYKKVGEGFWFADTHKIWRERYKSVVLAEGAWCSQRLFSKTPIRSVEDFRNKRLRVHNPQTAELMNAMGAKPVPLALPEVMPSLERGVIDGVFTSACYGDGQEYWRVAPNVQDWGLGPITGWAVIINADVWDKVPNDLKERIGKEMMALQREALDNHAKYDNAALERMKAGGAQLWTAPADVRQQLFAEKFVNPTFDSWYKRAKQVGFDGNAYIDRIRTTLGR
jgi:TRAP-type C4-dicarboxylate transport system substrate-binding protein